jgi:hypothetical protein
MAATLLRYVANRNQFARNPSAQQKPDLDAGVYALDAGWIWI